MAQVRTQPQLPAPSQTFFRAPLPPTTTGPAVQWFRSVAPTQGLPQQFTIASTQVTTPSIPVLTPSQPQPVTQMDTDLRREVEKLRQEVEALRNRVASTDVGPKSITASRCLSIDRQGYDEIYVVNFEVLNDTYRKILRAFLPGMHAEDVVFTWFVVRNVAQQIIYDPQKMVERGAAPFIASELKYGGRRPRPSTGPSLGSFDLSGSPGTDEFASASDYGAPLDVNLPDMPMGPLITAEQMEIAVAGSYRALAAPGPSRPQRTQFTALAETLGQSRSRTVPAPPSTLPFTVTTVTTSAAATPIDTASPTVSTPISTQTTLVVSTPTITEAVETPTPMTPGELSATQSQSSRTSSVGKKRKKTYAAMSTGGVAPKDRAVRPPVAREPLRAGLRPRSLRESSLALSSHESTTESDEELRHWKPVSKKSKARRGSPEIAKKAASEAARKAAPNRTIQRARRALNVVVPKQKDSCHAVLKRVSLQWTWSTIRRRDQTTPRNRTNSSAWTGTR